jgi:hypothetical protein
LHWGLARIALEQQIIRHTFCNLTVNGDLFLHRIRALEAPMKKKPASKISSAKVAAPIQLIVARSEQIEHTLGKQIALSTSGPVWARYADGRMRQFCVR